MMSEAERFLTALYEFKPKESYLLIWTLPDKHSRWFSDLGQAARYAEARASTCDVYFGVSLAERPYGEDERLKQGAREAFGIYGMWADIDIAGPGHTDKKTYPPTLEDARSLACEMGALLNLGPQILVHSGGGLHCHYLLKEPFIFEKDEDRGRARVICHQWKETLKERARRRGWEVDSVGDLERVLRVPGTLNHKGGEPRPVRLLE